MVKYISSMLYADNINSQECLDLHGKHLAFTKIFLEIKI